MNKHIYIYIYMYIYIYINQATSTCRDVPRNQQSYTHITLSTPLLLLVVVVLLLLLLL